MTSMKWRDDAEVVGIGAIVASLIFVGLQLRQDQKIAASQVFAEYVATGIGYQSTIAEHSEILVKGNSGAQLDEVEQHKLRILVQGAEDRIFQHGQAVGPLGLGMGRSERLFASFLYRNPIARVAWGQVGEDMVQYVDPLYPANQTAISYDVRYKAYRDRMQGYLDELDELYGRKH